MLEKYNSPVTSTSTCKYFSVFDQLIFSKLPILIMLRSCLLPTTTEKSPIALVVIDFISWYSITPFRESFLMDSRRPIILFAKMIPLLFLATP